MLPSTALVLSDIYIKRIKKHMGLYWPKCLFVLGVHVLNTLLVAWLR